MSSLASNIPNMIKENTWVNLLMCFCSQQKKNYDNIPRLLLLSGRTADGLRNVFEKVSSSIVILKF